MEALALVSHQLDKCLGLDPSTLTNLETKAKMDPELDELLLKLKSHFKKGSCNFAQLDSEQQIHSLEIKVREMDSLYQEDQKRLKLLEVERETLALKSDQLEEEKVKLKIELEILQNQLRKYEGQEALELAGRPEPTLKGLAPVSSTREDDPPLDRELERVAQLEVAASNFEAARLSWESERLILEGQITNLKQESELLRRELDEKAKFEEVVKTKDLPAKAKPDEESGEMVDSAVQSLAGDLSREEPTQQVTELLQTIEKLRSELFLQASHFHLELEAQSKLLEHHRSGQNEAEARCSELGDELLALRAKYASQVQHFEAYEAETLSAHHRLEAQIAQLQEQLKERSAGPLHADQPYAATLKLISQAQNGGKSFSEVFSDYVQAKRELLESQSNSKALRQSLDLLTVELEEQAPLLKEQRLDYDRLLDEATLMADLLNQAKFDYINAIETAKVRETTLRKEILHLKQASQGPTVEAPGEDGDSAIKHLQERIVELQLKIEEQETQSLSAIKELEASLEQQWSDKVKVLEDQAQAQMARIRAVEAERDALSQALSKRPPLPDTEPALQKDEEVAKLFKEKLELQTTCHELRINFDQLNAQHNLLKRDRDDRAKQAAKFEAQLQLLEERMAAYQKAASSQRMESQELRRRNLMLEQMFTNLEQHCGKLMNSVSESKANLNQALLQASNAKAECDLVKKDAERLHHENRSLTQEKSVFASRMINQQLKIDALTQNEASHRQQAASRILALKEERDAATQALESARAELFHQRQAHEQAVEAYQSRVDELTASINAAQEKLLVASEALKSSEKRMEALEAENKKLVGMFESLSGAEGFKEELFTTLSQLQEAQEALALSRQSEAQFQAISKASEEALQALGKTYEDFKASTREAFDEKEHKIQSDALLISQQAQRLQQLTEERDNLSEELVSSTQRFQQQITNLDDEIVRLKETVDQLEHSKQEMDAKLGELSKAEETSRNRYEKEVTAHAARVKQYAEAQSTILLQNQNLNSLKDDLARIQNEYQDFKSRVADEQNKSNEEVLALKARITELQEANHQLQHQPSAIPAAIPAQEPTSRFDPNHAIAKRLNLLHARIQVLEATNQRLELEKKSLSEQLRRKDAQWPPSTQAAEHQERINELTRKVNLLNESTAYLRQENQTLASQLASMEDQYHTRVKEQQLAQEQVRSLNSEVASKDKALQDARDETARWKAKLQEVVERTDKVSQEEHAQLKTKLSQVEEELVATQATLEKSTNEFKELSASSEATIAELKDKVAKLNRTGLHFKRSYDQLKAESLQVDSKGLAAKLEEANKAKLELETKVAELTNKLSNVSSSELTETQKLKDNAEKASKALEAEKERYAKLREVAIKMKHLSAEKGAENAKLKEELDKLTSTLALKDGEIKELSDSLATLTARKEVLDQEAAVAANKLAEAMAENSTKLERLEHEKDKELAAVREENEAKLSRLEMRHKAQLGRPQKIIEKLKDQIATLKAQLTEPRPRSEASPGLETSAKVSERAPSVEHQPPDEPDSAASDVSAKEQLQEQLETFLEASNIPIGSPPTAMAPGDNPDLVDEMVASLEEVLPQPTLKRSSPSDSEIIALDALPPKQPRVSTPEASVTPGFASPLMDPPLGLESPSALALELPRAEPTSSGSEEVEQVTHSDG